MKPAKPERPGAFGTGAVGPKVRAHDAEVAQESTPSELLCTGAERSQNALLVYSVWSTEIE